MTRTALPAACVLVAAALLLSACSAPATSTTTGASAGGGTAASAPAETSKGSSADGGAYGCTDAMIAFMDANGYPSPTPHAVTEFSFPEASASGITPTCYVQDEFGSAFRKGAMFTGDTDAALAQIGAALTAAGYQQNSGYGASVWWIGGDDPSNARYAVGAGPQQVDGQTVIWATWASH